jgi:hypothetical protein
MSLQGEEEKEEVETAVSVPAAALKSAALDACHTAKPSIL